MSYPSKSKDVICIVLVKIHPITSFVVVCRRALFPHTQIFPSDSPNVISTVHGWIEHKGRTDDRVARPTHYESGLGESDD